MHGARAMRHRFAVHASRVGIAAIVLLFATFAGQRDAGAEHGGAPPREGGAKHLILPVSGELSIIASDPRADTLRGLNRRRSDPTAARSADGVSPVGLLFLPAFYVRNRPRRGLAGSVLARCLAPRGPPRPSGLDPVGAGRTVRQPERKRGTS